ncbi:hypothetical protein BJY01DRAFT_222233 [Aspergillus pseudoustus]|uniref:Uncharacterized protein n=1 Tax=Aspergillus pseudoustus TaxID=1810923 RepID=A0ABR4J870_9EURO
MSLYVNTKQNPVSTPDLSTSESKKKTDILLAILSEAKSLPRETDTHPTSPTPDLPSPAQERLLELVRRVQESTELELALSRSSRDSGGYGYGIELDAGGDGDGDGYGGVSQGEQEKEEEYELLKDVIRASFPAFPPPTSPSVSHPAARAKERGTDIYREQREPENRIDDAEFPTSPFDSTPSSSSHPLLAQPQPHLQTPSSPSHRRKSSASGPLKQFNNQISFLAFLTKEQLLLSPGVGERIAIEMVRDTLSHHGSSISIYSHPHQHQAPQQQHAFSGGGGGESQSPPWFGDAGPASIAAAALWMIIMGEELYARIREQERERDSRVGTGSVKGGGGRSGGIAHEWETWTARLQYLSLRDDLSLEARECAAEGAAVMRRV